jgi:enoyl-CoA hydratase
MVLRGVLKMQYINVDILTPDHHIAVVTLNRPDKLNSFNSAMAHEIIQVMNELYENDSLRVLILTGTGRAFSTGADLQERDGMETASWRVQHKLVEDMFASIRKMHIPTIAAVNGYALAGGFELALSCDVIICQRSSVFGMPEPFRGLCPGGGGTQILSRLIGRNKAKELLFTARKFDAYEAEKLGVIIKVVENGTLRDEALEIAKNIAKNAPLAIQQIKKSIDIGSDLALEAGLSVELQSHYSCINTEDRLEGINAFVEKRDPVFLGK